ncbi:cms1 ribosomal small subunit [Entophlyctis sp. JEL0112]|nr:cms1 ribosomal small subunit [Entophlyctis sp. JEL0112]
MGADDLDDDFHLIASPPRRKRTHQEQSDDEDPSIFDIAPDASDELPSNAEDSVQREIQPARKKKKTKTKDHSTKWSEQRLKLRSEILQESGVHESQVPDSDFTLDADRSLPSLLKLTKFSVRKSDDRQILIICPSAERAITIGPALKSIGKIGKLFARHMKVEEQLKSLRSHSFPICVGTPNRILKLLEAGW